MAKLRPRARIVRTIGDQLISGPEAALIELVKNSYDADASVVSIKISPRVGLNETGGGQIIIADDGHGMSYNDLVEKWLEPATENKVSKPNSPGHRAMLGAKGIGRFAASRLGHLLFLESFAQNETSISVEKSELKVDWDIFGAAKYLDEIDIDIQKVEVTDRKSPTGLRLTISNLRDIWTKQQLTQLVRELRRLLSPVNREQSTFKVFLDLTAFTEEAHGFQGQHLVSEWSEKSGAPSNGQDSHEVLPFQVQDIFHYRIQGVFDKSGSFTGTFDNARAGSTPVPVSIPGPGLLAEELPCGELKVQLNIYDREGSAVQEIFENAGAKGIGKLEARKLLDENTGVGIYRNNFRIRPYGDVNSDWLELETKRVQNPSLKIGLSQVWGLVDVESESESCLIERSSREGFEHSGSFLRLKTLVTGLISYVEVLRRDYREKAGLSRKQTATTAVVQSSAEFRATQKAVSDLPIKFRERIQKAFLKDKESLKTAIADLETYQQALTSRSTLGLVVSQVLHDGRRFLADISTRSEALTKGAPRVSEASKFGDHFRATLAKNAESIHRSGTDLGRLFKALDPVSGRRRGKPRDLDPAIVLKRSLSLFEDAIGDAHIQVQLIEKDVANVYGYESDLVAALLNIVDNAIYWLKASPRELRLLTFSFSKTVKYVRLSITNNGPRIDPRFLEKLFSPGFTLKSEGSGIGLAIAREALRSSKWDLAFDSEHEDTSFVIEMTRNGGT